MLESKIEHYMEQQARLYDTMYLKFVSPGKSGVPDRILIHRGNVTFIELKAPGKEPRPLQNTIFNKMRKHGAVIKVIDSIEAVDVYFLKQYEKDMEQDKSGRFIKKNDKNRQIVQNNILSCKKTGEKKEAATDGPETD